MKVNVAAVTLQQVEAIVVGDRAAEAEVSESFGAQAAPMVVSVEGQERRLTGTAQAQYEGWRRLLKEIYQAETGFTQQIEVGTPARTTESTTAD